MGLDRIPLVAKFLLAPTIGAALTAALAAIFLGGVRDLGGLVDGIRERELASIRSVTDLYDRLVTNHAAIYELLIDVKDGTDEETVFEASRPLLFELHRIESALRAEVASSPEAEAPSGQKLLAVLGRYRSAATNGVLSSAVSMETARRQMRLATSEFNQASALLVAHLRAREDGIDRRLADARHEAEVRSNLFAVVALSAVLATLLVGLTLSRVLSSGIRRMIGVLTRLAAGETELPIPMTDAADELGEMARGLSVFRESLESLRLRRRAIESASTGIFFCDSRRDGRPIDYVNPAFARIVGLAPEEATGRGLASLLGPTPDRSLVERIDRALGAGEELTLEFVAARPDGSWLDGQLHLAPIPDPGGEVSHYVGILTDLTEMRALERQLQQSQKLEAVGQLAGGVAHDFNNYLTVMGGYAEQLADELGKGDPRSESVQAILDAVERSAGLTRQLLALSRRQVMQPRVLDLNAVVRSMDPLLRRTLGEDIDLDTVLGGGLGQVRADPTQVEQVLLNLAVNARDAMPEGGALTIESGNVYLDDEYVGHHPGIEPGRYVMLAVSDSGCGIPAEIRGRVFEPFFTTKRVGKGTGLGLSTVHGIVRQSGGSISVYSEEGRGTTVKIYLPRVEEEAQSLRAEPSATLEERGSETILVVEDNEMVRRLARRLLEGAGYTVLEASDGRAALALVSQAGPRPDLVLTDVVMPSMGGLQLAEALEEIQPGMRLLFMSGFTENGTIHRGILDPGDNLLHKPFTRHDLLRRVRQALDRP